MLCSRNNLGIILVPYNERSFFLPTEEENSEIIVKTIYEADYSTVFREFMRLYMTKPHQVRHQIKFVARNIFREKITIYTFLKLIMFKLNHKLSKIKFTNLNSKANGVSSKVKEYYAQTFWDFRRLYLKELPITIDEYNGFIVKWELNIDESIERERIVSRLIEERLTYSQFLEIYPSSSIKCNKNVDIKKPA